MRRLACLLLLVSSLATAATARADAVDNLLAQAGLVAGEVDRKPDGKSWGEIFGTYFSGRPFGRSVALVIGVNQYKDGAWPQLDATRGDPARVRQLLVEQEGFDLVVTLENERATKERIDALMRDVLPDLLRPDDRFLFYFSGHGTQREIQGVGYAGYLPLTASGRSYGRMVSMADLREWDRQLTPVKQVLFLLDSCFSGIAGAQPMSEQPNLEVGRLADYSHHLITAGTAGEQTIAGDAWKGSIFTDSLIRGAEGWADRGWEDTSNKVPKDGVVSLFELKDYITKRVASEAPRQGWKKSIRPQLYPLNSDNKGEFFFVTREKKLEGKPQAQLVNGVPVGMGGARPGGTELEPVEREGSVIGKTNVRAEPSTGSARVATLEGGTQVYVAGKVKGQPWLLVERDGERVGYVFEDRVTLEDSPPARPGQVERPRPPPEVVSAAEAPKAPLVAGPVELVARAPPADADPPYEPGDVFRDCAECPEMVVAPAGRFMMGSPPGEAGRGTNEGPQHPVTIARPFAAGRFEVTFAEWDACVAGGGCGGYKPSDVGWGRGRRPAINVSWDDAKAYVAWLGRKAGQPYRLLSEAEWEYVARAGTDTPFWTGATISTDQANYDGNYVYDSGQKGQHRQKTVEVGTLPSNPWKLHEMHGNVREWVEDTYHGTYNGAPSDGSAWVEGGESDRVLRGGSWILFERPEHLRAAARGGLPPEYRDVITGFRVARTLTP